ncbi:MAG: hypothetical protein HY721_30160 [Planctomycetes bacterium]|nr:hypothetical protein [Planctomycetota bacterium]
MKSHPARTLDRPTRRGSRSWSRIGLAAGALLGLSLSGSVAEGEHDGACTKTTRHVFKSCRYEALDDYWLARGNCENLADIAEREACKRAVQRALREALEECKDQRDARGDVCEALGEAPYDPVIDPEDFVRRVDNPFFPLVPGTTFVYESETEEGLERVEVEVTDQTKEILGVLCTVVRDTEMLDGEVVEATDDWFAQDKMGNVWYFGEHSEEYEDGVLVSLEGSWEAGVDGAKPGIIMQAEPRVGDVYRQEFFLGEAEDMGEVIALDQSVTVPFGAFEGCLQTGDFSPLEPDALEHKFYAPGVGLVLEVNVETGRRTELVAVIRE